MNAFVGFRIKFLVIAISLLISSLSVLRLGFTVPANISSADSDSMVSLFKMFNRVKSAVIDPAVQTNISLNDNNIRSTYFEFNKNLLMPRNAHLKSDIPE